MPADIAAALLAALQPASPPEAIAWLVDSAAAVERDGAAFAPAFTEAARRIGRGLFVQDGKRKDGLWKLALGGLDVELTEWRRCDAARVILALALAKREPKQALRHTAARFTNAENEEKVSALRAFAFLPGGLPSRPLSAPAVEGVGAAEFDDGPTAALRAVLEACRSNIVPLFDAATANNAFFSLAAPELEFNKAVLKRVFIGVTLNTVLNLKARANAELSRMLLNLVEEREVSWRAYPPEVWPVIAGYPLPGVAAKMIGLLEHPDDWIRAAVAEGLARINDLTARRFAADRLSREKQPAVKAALAWAANEAARP